ncbi:MAG: 1,4-alpha-glucan branching protein domain-containing protein [Phycisphaerales bacterium]
MAIGSFCLVLHGHLPYVLRHGIWPHGEDWLYEAAAETYLPILAMIDECAFLNGNPKITMGLTPVLLEQLAHEHFKKGFEHYLEDRIDRAKQDRKDFERFNNGHMIYLADRWVEWFGRGLEQFKAMNRDIPRAFAERAKRGQVEILTSNATHGYMPLLMEDSAIRGQIRAGLASSERILGYKPTGMWLPECAYRPHGPWTPPLNWGGPRNRIGIEYLVADEGVNHFFVENHLIEGARSEFINNGGWQKCGWEEGEKYASRGWRNVHEPHLVGSDGMSPGRVAAFARDPSICEQVWSGSIGYPADGVYLEFHKKWGERRGLRYWKITGKGTDLGEKHLYYPENVDGKVFEHARNFCDAVKAKLWDYHHKTGGRHGVVTACFDAELFGHWWFEGPQFLRDVMLTLNSEPDVDVCTTVEFLERRPPDKSASLPEGSWGEKGDHRVWMNDQVRWMWEIEYRCETTFGRITYELPWRNHPELQKLLEMAGRELLLLQASDWPFVITRGQAVDYGIKRFIQHVGRFDCLCDIAEKLSRDSQYLGRMNEIERFEVQDVELHDVIFPKIDLNWWNM